MARPATITIIGDIHYELAARLNNTSFSELTRDTQCDVPIRSYAGGTAINLARACRKHFSRVQVCGALGADEASHFIRQELNKQHIDLLADQVADMHTGRLIYLRDSHSSTPESTRLLVVDKGANVYLSTEFISENNEKIFSSEILHIDGYSLLDESRRNAVELSLQYARKAQRIISLDLVPHDIHNYIGLSELSIIVGGVDYIFVSARTVLALDKAERYFDSLAHKDAVEAWDMLNRHFPGLNAFIQYGLYDIEFSLVCRAGNEPMVRNNGVIESTNLSGLGDLLAANDLGQIEI